MGIDLRGGVLAVFDTAPKTDGKPQPTSTEIDATVRRIENALTSRGLVESNVIRQGSKIRIEAPGLKDTDEIFDAIGAPAILDFRDEQGNICVEAQDIRRVAVYQDSKTLEYGVLLTFTSEGGSKFRKMIQAATEYTYIHMNNSTEPWSTIRVADRNAGANNTTVITLGTRADGSRPTRVDAERFKLEIESGLYEVKLIQAELSIVQQTLGEGALLGGIIALLVGMLFIFIFMYVRYRDLGLLSNLSMILFTILFLGALAIVNAVQLTLPGIAGIVLALVMAVDANIIIFERIRDEYRSGKRMAISIENGFNKSFWTIFDANITTVIGTAVLYFLGTGPIKGFAITLLLGVVISMFCSLVVTRSFAKLYLHINGNNAKRVRLENINPFVPELGTKEKPTTGSDISAKPKRKLNLGGGG